MPTPSDSEKKLCPIADATTDGEKAGTWWHTAALGGGAMLDFCCYGAMASNYLIGRPATAAMGMRLNSMHPLGDADDNAAMIVRYPDCMAVLEGSWTVPAGAAPPAPTLYGTEGMAECASVADGVQITVRDFHGHSEQLPVLAPEEHLRDITTAFVHHVLTGEPMPEVLDVKHNLEALAILDAGLRAAEAGRMELVPTRAWAIGG